MNIEQTLYDAAIDLIKNRYPSGWEGQQQCILRVVRF